MTVNALQIPRPLTVSEKALNGFTHYMKVTYLDALAQTTAATALTVNLVALAVGMSIKALAFELITPFADSRDTGNNTTTVAIASGGTSLISAQECNLNGTYVARAREDTIHTVSTAEELTLTFGAAASGKYLSNLTQGEVHIFFNLEYPARLG